MCKNFLFLFILFFSFTSCKDELHYNDKLYIGNYYYLSGSYSHYDSATPFPAIIEFKNDSLLLKNLKNEVKEKSYAPYEKLREGMKIPFFTDSIYFEFNGNEATLHTAQDAHQKMEVHIFRTLKTPAWKKEDVLKHLTQQPYAAFVEKATSPNRDFDIKKELKFSKDSLTTTWFYSYKDILVHSETQTKSYMLSKINDAYFFTENKGEHTPLYKVYQIAGIEENSIRLLYYDEQEKRLEKYTAVTSQKESEPQSFKKCSEARPIEYYSGDDYTYTMGNDYILEQVQQNAPDASGDGYITVQFIINCKREIGQLGLELMDRSYNTTSFNPELVKHIVTKVRSLKEWPTQDDNKLQNDIHAFLMFKIENGKITDLCP